MKAAAFDPGYVLEQYEALRREALAPSQSASAYGLLLFLTQGMVAWMSALSSLCKRTSLYVECPSELPVRGCNREMTRLLANMVLECLGGGPQ